jgi:hypothetical protein
MSPEDGWFSRSNGAADRVAVVERNIAQSKRGKVVLRVAGV